MSLSSILHSKEARQALKGLVVNPRIPSHPPALVPRTCSNPSRMGTAFDYALRLGLQQRTDVVGRSLVAEHTRKELLLTLQFGEASARLASQTLEESLAVIDGFRWTESLSEEAATACLRLAELDVIYRAGIINHLGSAITSGDIKELQSLFEVVPWDEFEPFDRLLLNPTFNEGSLFVGGADADLLLDDLLIEVKTQKSQTLDLETVRQLVGYMLLANTFGVTGSKLEGRPEVGALAIYLSRAGHLHAFEIADCVADKDRTAVLDFILSDSRSSSAGC